MVYCLVLFTYLFFDYNFSNGLLPLLGVFNVFSVFYWVVDLFILPLNFVFYIFFNDNLNLYNSLFLYFTDYFTLVVFFLFVATFKYLFILLYANTYLVFNQFAPFLHRKFNLLVLNLRNFSFFWVLDFSPLANFYKPFFSNNNVPYKSNSVNMSFNLFKSFVFYFKNKLLMNLNTFVLFLLNIFTSLYAFFRKPLWKPLSKKTSYFGLYSSFKNKY